ncbi:MAG: DUF2207 domain-containing protein [bacterium]
MKKIIFISLCAFSLIFYSPALAQNDNLVQQNQEFIENYHVDIYINKDNSIKVKEKIEYDFGESEKHGIYREIPYQYNTVTHKFSISIEILNVVDGAGNQYQYKESTFKKDGKKYLLIRIGDPDSYVTGRKTYIIEYMVKDAIRNYKDMNDLDELYWNAIGIEWEVPIYNASATVYLPEKVKSDELDIDCYVGELGSTERCVLKQSLVDASGLAKVINFDRGNGKNIGGLTIFVGLPKGVVYRLNDFDRVFRAVKNNKIIFLPAVIFLIMFALWYKYGKDPKGRGIIIAQYEAPDNLTPIEVGTIYNKKIDDRNISAQIISLAIQGYLKIRRIESVKNLSKANYEFKN